MVSLTGKCSRHVVLQAIGVFVRKNQLEVLEIGEESVSARRKNGDLQIDFHWLFTKQDDVYHVSFQIEPNAVLLVYIIFAFLAFGLLAALSLRLGVLISLLYCCFLALGWLYKSYMEGDFTKIFRQTGNEDSAAEMLQLSANSLLETVSGHGTEEEERESDSAISTEEFVIAFALVILFLLILGLSRR